MHSPKKTDHDKAMKNADSSGGESKYSHLKTNRSAAAIRGVLWSGINTVIPTLLNSLVFIVSSRYLMPVDFGIIALALSITSFAIAIAPAALGEALIQQFHIRKGHLDTVFWVCVISALVIYLILIGISPIISTKMHHPELSKFLPLLGLKLFFDLLPVVPNALIARAMSFHLIALRTVIATLVSSVICISLLVAGYGIWALAISQLAVSVTSCIAAFLGAKWKPGIEINFKDLQELFKYGFFASANRFLQLMNLDQIIIGSLMGTAALGIFNFSRRLFQMINEVIAGSLTSVTHALLSSLQNETEKVRDAFLMATFGSSVVSFPAFVGLAFIVGDAIPLVFGVQWTEAITPTRWFCLVGLMSCIGVIQSSLINSQGKSDWWFYYQLFRQILTIGTIFVLFDRSITFIVMVIAVQTLLCWPMTLVMVSKIIQLKITSYFRQFLGPLISSMVMLAGLILTEYLCKDFSPTTRIIIEILVSIPIYSLSILILSKAKVMAMAKNFLNKRK